MNPEILTALNNVGRLQALERLRLLNTEADEAFDRFTRLVSRTLPVPIALVNLISNDRQFFKSAVGMGGLCELPIGTGVCSTTLVTRTPLMIQDARADARFSANPIVTEYGLVAYIGVPIITHGGDALGTFCVVDTEPRVWTADDLQTMRDLAAAVTTEIDLRLTLLDLRQSHWHLKREQEHLPICMTCSKVRASDAQHWQALAAYLTDNDIVFTHGYCPECAKQVARDWGV